MSKKIYVNAEPISVLQTKKNKKLLMSVSPSTKKKEEKVLSKEEAEACTERLYDRSMQDMKRRDEKRKQELANPPGRVPAKKITTTDLDSLVNRVYTRQLEMKQNRAAEVEKKQEKEATATKKTLSEEELQESVQRMYNQQREIKMKTMQKLEKQFHPPPEKKTLTKDQVVAVGDRLSKGWKEQKEAAKQKIWARDYAAMEPKQSKITPDEVKEMANRLCTTKPAQ